MIASIDINVPTNISLSDKNKIKYDILKEISYLKNNKSEVNLKVNKAIKNLYYNEKQYYSKLLIEEIINNSLLSYEAVTVLANNQNTIYKESLITNKLIDYFISVKNEIINNEEGKMENLQVKQWAKVIEDYNSLSLGDKIINLAFDFMRITKGSFRAKDLFILKDVLIKAGFSLDWTISYCEIICYILSNEELFNNFFEEDTDTIEKCHFDDTIVINSLIKAKLLYTKEKYIISTIKMYTDIADSEIIVSTIINYIKSKYNIDITKEINIYDFFVEFIYNVNTYNERIVQISKK